MAPKVSVSINCPYCGFRNHYTLEMLASSYIHPELVRCDLDEGGCDKQFVLYPKVEVTATARKIEGEEDDS